MVENIKRPEEGQTSQAETSGGAMDAMQRVEDMVRSVGGAKTSPTLSGSTVAKRTTVKEKNENAGPAPKEKDDDGGLKTAPEVIDEIKAVTSLRELNSLVKGEERKTVLDAAEKKRAELKGE